LTFKKVHNFLKTDISNEVILKRHKIDLRGKNLAFRDKEGNQEKNYEE